MPRKNLTGTWGEHRGLSVRLTRDERQAIRELRALWHAASDAEVVRRAIRETAEREREAHPPAKGKR